jgi:hypothetical protein
MLVGISSKPSSGLEQGTFDRLPCLEVLGVLANELGQEPVILRVIERRAHILDVSTGTGEHTNSQAHLCDIAGFG